MGRRSRNRCLRVALTVLGRDSSATAVEVDETGAVIRTQTVPKLNADLSAVVDVASAAEESLQANKGVSYLGFLVNGPGFILDEDEARGLLQTDGRHRDVLKPYVSGRDIAGRDRRRYVIDFGTRSVTEAREYPLLYNLVVDRVKPTRDANRDRGIRENWWRFHRIRHELRAATRDLARFIATPETTKHRYFVFLDADTAPDHTLICIASDDYAYLGVLSSTIHVTWSLASGGTLEDRPRYNKTVCFEPFPFPEFNDLDRARVARIAESLHRHRSEALARDDRVTVTGMYNVVAKLRKGDQLTAAEQAIHNAAACHRLRELHDELDEAVATAYGWAWPMSDAAILASVVELHTQRVAAEQSGDVAWIRPAYQRTLFGSGVAEGQPLELDAPTEALSQEKPAWPTAIVEQIRALQSILEKQSCSVEDVSAQFSGVRRDNVARLLDTLAVMGEVHRGPAGLFTLPKSTRVGRPA